ncbi:MAG: hypothetical protein ACT4TC_26100 [Myxococcaceae bacterium]
MSRFLVLSTAVALAGCSPFSSGPGPELRSELKLEGFQNFIAELIPTEDVLLARVGTMAGPGEKAFYRLLAIDTQLVPTELLRSEQDLTSGRIALAADKSVWVTKGTLDVDETFSTVEARQLRLGDRELLGSRSLPTRVLNLPAKNAVALGVDGSLWLLVVNAEFDLTLYRLVADDAVRAVPVAKRITVDLSSGVVAWAGGVIVATRINGNDTAAAERWKLPSGRAQIAIASLDLNGQLIQAAPLDLPEASTISELSIYGSTLLLAGEASDTSDSSCFVSRWSIGASGALEHQSTERFRPGENRKAVHAVLIDGDRTLVAGEVGFTQASTGSVMSGSHAFLGILREPGRTLLGDGVRRNVFTDIVRWKGDVWLAATTDFPKTHDADQDPAQGYARAELFRLIDQ